MLDVHMDDADKNRIKDILKSMDAEKEDNSVKRGIMSASAYVLAVLKSNVTGQILMVRTGNLQRSMGMRIVKNEGAWEGVVGSGAKIDSPEVVTPQPGEDLSNDGIRMSYADILEQGGTITPINKRFLAIPIGDALTPSGVSRFSAQQLKDNPSGFGYATSVIIGGIIFGIKDKKTRSEMTPLFALKRSVTIPAKHYMEISVLESEEQAGKEMLAAVEQGFRK